MPTTLTLRVHGMTCGGCENAVKRAVGSIAGITEVTASHRDHQVVVTFDASVASTSDIEAKIGRLGYIIEP